MRRISLFLVAVSLLSCVSPPKTNNESVKPSVFAHVIFFNYSREDIYLHLMERGKSEVNIGSINIDEYGRLNRVDSLIHSGKSAEFIIPPGYYTIVPKKDLYGRQDADFNMYDEFRFFPSEEPYIIHLFPKHKQITTAVIIPSNSQINSQNSLFPSFDIQFSDEMIKPLVEQNIALIDENEKPIKINIQWHNNYKLTIHPQEQLQPSTHYSVLVENGARNVECEQIIETAVYSFTTGNIVDSVSPFDTATVKYTYISGNIRIDWSLPSGAKGSEIHIPGNPPEELYAKTNYIFSSDAIEQIEYKIVPYGMINEKKVYNQADQRRSYTKIPRLYFYGITHTVITNTVDSLEFRFIFNDPLKITPDFQFILKNKLGGANLAVLNAQNNFTYKINNPTFIPDEEITYILTIDNSTVDYTFTIKRPSDSEFYEAFEKKVIKDMETIAQKFIAIDRRSFTMSGELVKDVLFYNEKRTLLISIYNEYTGYAYPSAYNIESYKKRVQSNEVFSRIQNLYNERLNLLVENLIVSAASGYNTAEARITNTKNWLDNILSSFETYAPWLAIKDKKNIKAAIDRVNNKYTKYAAPFFWGIGTSVGSSFTTPWAIGTIQLDISPFSYTILEFGCDFGLIHGYERKDIEYYSLYPFGHLVFSPNIKKYEYREPFILYAGIGGGAMLSSYKTATENNSLITPAVDLTAGFYLGSDHHCFHVSYTLRTTFSVFNHKAAIGYTYRF